MLQAARASAEATRDMAHTLQPTLGTAESVPIGTRPTRTFRPSLDDVWAALAVLIPVIVSLATRLVAIDLAYHVRAGEQVLGGSIPHVESWTFTIRGVPWVDQQWGAQALLALAHRGGGFATIAVVRAALIGATFGLVYLACRAKGAEPRSASLLSLGGFVVCFQTLSMRPQLFGVALFAASLWILAGRRDHPARLWFLPVVAVIWANLHGSFVLAPLLVLVSLGEDLIERDPGWRRLALVGGITALVTLANPFGVEAWTYVWRLSTNPTIRATVTEWAPMSLATFSEVAFFASAAAAAVWLVRRRGPVPWGGHPVARHVLPVPAAGTTRPGLVGARRARHVGGTAGRTRARPRAGTRRLNAAVIAALVGVAIVSLPWWRAPSDAGLVAEAPTGLAAAAEQLPAGSLLLVPQPWGSWFEVASPATPLFVDPRIELFPPDVWNDYLTVRNAAPGWQAILDRYEVEAVVVDRRTWRPLLSELRADPGWASSYEDPDGVLFVRVHATGQV